jgi:outer membrane protein TolC
MVSRPEIQSRAWTLAALGEDVTQASLSPFQGGEVGIHGERDGSWVVGPMLTTPLPIFDFGQAARAKAVAERAAAYLELEQQRSEVIEEIRRAYDTYNITRDSLQAAQTRLLPVQEQQRAQASLSYHNGESDLTTLLLAETSYQQTLAKVAEMRHKLTLAVIRLERAAGGAVVAADLEQVAASASPSTTQSAVNDRPSP